MAARAELNALLKLTDELSRPFDAAMKNLGKAASMPLKALGGLASGLGDIAKIGAGVALGGALTSLPGQLLSMAQGAAADEQATARLGQAIRNLGGDFDGIMGQVNEAISAGQKLAFTDDEVRDSFQFLAAATGDADEALRRQKSAMDLARGANIPLSMATKMLGKLNEENIEVFKKLGITLGDTATEAEALAAVQAKFGGQAAAYANSTAGQFEQAKIAISEIQESIGSALLPILAKVGGILTENLPAIQEWVGAFAGGLANVIGPAVQEVWGNLQAFVMWLVSGDLGHLDDTVFVPWRTAMDAVRNTVMSLVETAMAVLPDLGTAISQAFAFFTTGSGDIEVFRGVLNKLLGEEGAQGVIVVFTNLTGFIQQDLIPAFQTAGEIINKVLTGDLSGALSQVGEIVKAVAPRIAEALVEWGRQFVAWVAVMWPPLQAELLRVGQQVLDWAVAEGPQIAAVLVEWGRQFWAWVAPMVPPLLAELGIAALRVLAWMGEQALALNVKAYSEWVPALVNWVGDVAPGVLTKLGEFAAAVGKWLKDDAVTWLMTDGAKLGLALVQGIWEGLRQQAGWLERQITGLLAGALGAAKKALGISSPSKVWEDEIGIPIIEGIVEGILGGETALVDAVEEITTPLRNVAELLDHELTPAFDLMMHAGSEALDTLAPESGGLVGTYERLGEAVGVRLVDAFHDLGLEAEDVFDKARASALQLLDYLSEILSLLSRIDVPGVPAGGAGGGGGGGSGGPEWSLFPDPGPPGSPSNPGTEGEASVVINQVIDNRGNNTGQVERETMAALSRARLVSGVVGG